MPLTSFANRDGLEERDINGRRDPARYSARRSTTLIEPLTAAGAKTARRHGSGSPTKVAFKQKMPAPSEKPHRKHRTSRTTVHKSSKIESEHRREHSHRHRSREAEPDSEDDYVYSRETRERRKAPQVERQRYEEVKRLGRDREEEAAADARQAEHRATAERPRASRTKTSHHHHHHHHHRDETERSRDHRTHWRPRTEEEEREREEMRRNRRASRESEHAHELQQAGGRYDHRLQLNTGFWSKFLGKRSKSAPAPPSPHRPRAKRNLSDPVLASPRHEFQVPECDDIPRQHAPEKHKSEHKKDNHTSILAGMFGAPAVKVKEPAPVKPVKLVSCVVCMDDDVKSTKAPKLKCGHRMCHSCLRRSFKLSIKDPQQMPPKCCTTDQIPLHVVDKIFTNEWKKKWNRKYEEYSTKNRIYCPAKKCGEWIRPDDIKKVEGKKQGVCRKCKTKVCGTCNAKWHGAKECPKDAETNALLEKAREAGWQRCYSCRTLVELKEGCNHMTCRCTAEFCMLCGLKWRTCECPWFNYETVEADRLAHMRPINEEPLLGRPPLPPLFPRPRPPRLNANANLQNPFDAFFVPPPRAPHAHAPVMPMPMPNMPPQQPIDVFAAFGQMMNQQMNAQQQQAAERQRQREQHRQLLRAQQQLEERQRQLRTDEELARNVGRLDLANEQAERPRRRRQASMAGSEAPASVQAGLGGPGRRRGSDRVNGWIQFVQPELRAVPVR